MTDPFIAVRMLGGTVVEPPPSVGAETGVPRTTVQPARHALAPPRAGRPSGEVDRSVLDLLAPFTTPQTTDVLVNGDGGLWVDDGAGLRLCAGWSADERAVRDLATRLVARGGRHVDEAHPCVDVRLGDSIRVHVVLPPVSTAGTLISVRIPVGSAADLAALRASGMLGSDGGSDLAGLVARRTNILITGAAGAGKTTLLAALLALAPPDERIVTVEDVAELRIDHPHVVGLEARQANLEGAGRIGLESLVREALRMRPDRLVLGECRGGELRELLSALNTGHDGGAGTLHANSLDDVPARIEALGALAGLSDRAVARQTVSAIGRVIHLERSGGRRRVAGTGRFVLDDRGRLAVVPT